MLSVSDEPYPVLGYWSERWETCTNSIDIFGHDYEVENSFDDNDVTNYMHIKMPDDND